MWVVQNTGDAPGGLSARRHSDSDGEGTSYRKCLRLTIQVGVSAPPCDLRFFCQNSACISPRSPFHGHQSIPSSTAYEICPSTRTFYINIYLELCTLGAKPITRRPPQQTANSSPRSWLLFAWASKRACYLVPNTRSSWLLGGINPVNSAVYERNATPVSAPGNTSSLYFSYVSRNLSADILHMPLDRNFQHAVSHHSRQQHQLRTTEHAFFAMTNTKFQLAEDTGYVADRSRCRCSNNPLSRASHFFS